MQRMFLASVAIALAAVSAPVAVHAQGQQPTFATTKVTDNVYYFRYQGHQAMFIVTPAAYGSWMGLDHGGIAQQVEHRMLRAADVEIDRHPIALLRGIDERPVVVWIEEA